MKWYLSAEIEADTLEEAWRAAAYELPLDFNSWVSDRVKMFSLEAAGGRPAVSGERE